MTAAQVHAEIPAGRHFPAAVTDRAAAPFSLLGHRRASAASLIEALAGRYPVVRNLLGEDSFREIARYYAAIEPFAPGSLSHYGQSFPDFVRNLGGAASFDYLADVAEFENARARAQSAPSVEPLDIAAFSDLSAAKFAFYRVALHPSVNLVISRFPVVSIWEANQQGRGNEVLQWNGQSALVARVRDSVETWLLPAGGFGFFSELMAGASLQQAIDRAAQGFDLAGNLTMLLASGLAIGLHRVGTAPRAA